MTGPGGCKPDNSIAVRWRPRPQAGHQSEKCTIDYETIE